MSGIKWKYNNGWDHLVYFIFQGRDRYVAYDTRPYAYTQTHTQCGSSICGNTRIHISRWAAHSMTHSPPQQMDKHTHTHTHTHTLIDKHEYIIMGVYEKPSCCASEIGLTQKTCLTWQRQSWVINLLFRNSICRHFCPQDNSNKVWCKHWESIVTLTTSKNIISGITAGSKYLQGAVQ